ncbi:MAG: hypothetical protein ABUK15_07280 [Anaerolineales bacterium]
MTSLLLALPSTAIAASACLPHDKMLDLLASRYNEYPSSVGLEHGGRLIEVFTAEDGSTWTLAMTTPDGATCVIAAGVEWMEALATKETY